jgi:hypothetical protein
MSIIHNTTFLLFDVFLSDVIVSVQHGMIIDLNGAVYCFNSLVTRIGHSCLRPSTLLEWLLQRH